MYETIHRGKDTYGHWKIGVLYYGDNPNRPVIIEQSNGKLNFHMFIRKDTIGIYTRIKDKSGRKIFTGDVVKTKHNRLCVVQVRHTRQFVGIDLTPIMNSKNLEYLPPDEFDLFDSVNLELITNTVDDPEYALLYYDSNYEEIRKVLP